MVVTRNKTPTPPGSPKLSQQDSAASTSVVTPSKNEKHSKSVIKKHGKPKNVIAAGQFSAQASYGQRKDTRSKMYYEFLACGIAIVYVARANSTDEAFLMHDYKDLMQDMDLKQRMKIITICARRGSDGNQIPSNNGTTYPFRQFVLGISPATHSQAKKQVKDLLEYLNKSQDNADKYKYPKKIRLVEDFTQDTPRPADARLLDNEVVNMMKACYDCPLQDLMQYDEVMSEFWSDIEYGKSFLDEYMGNVQQDEDVEGYEVYNDNEDKE